MERVYLYYDVYVAVPSSEQGLEEMKKLLLLLLGCAVQVRVHEMRVIHTVVFSFPL